MIIKYFVPFDKQIFVHQLSCEFSGGTLPYNGYDLAFVKANPDRARESHPLITEELLLGKICCYHGNVTGVVCS